MRVEMQPVVINGSHGEGGGALLRSALAMSALTQQAVRVHNIRGALRRPGLNAEDLTFVQVLAASSRAKVSGDELEEKELVFEPGGPPRSVDVRVDVGSHEKGAVSGSAPVIASSLLPVLCRAGAYSRVTVLGETHGPNMLGYDAFERASLPVHRAQGVYGFLSLAWASFGLTARGEMALEVEPSVPEAFEWKDRGKPVAGGAVVTLSEVPEDVGERGARKLRSALADRGFEPQVEVLTVRSRSPGVSVTVWSEFERGRGSGTALGQRGLRMETVVDNALRSFDEWFDSPATLDSFLADQVMLIAAQAEGRTVYTTPRVTRRLVTLAWVVKQFMPVHIVVKGEEGFPGTVTIER